MKAMLTGFAAIIVIGVGAHFALQQIGFGSDERNAGAAVRLE